MQSIVSRLFEALEVGSGELTTGTIPEIGILVLLGETKDLRGQNVEPVRPTTETTSSDFRHFH